MFGRNRKKKILATYPNGIQFSIEGFGNLCKFLKIGRTPVAKVLRNEIDSYKDFQFSYY